MKFLFWLITNTFNGLTVVLFAFNLIVESYASTLPAIQDYDSPPIMSRAYDSDGNLIGQYAREKRLFTPYELMPKHLIQAFVAAEDQNFFNHPGVDGQGFARAFRNNMITLILGTGQRLEGASTITQQLVKNLYLSNDRSIERKIKEILLSIKIEQTYSKSHILELYLNWIYLGEGAHGVGEAALTYFGKPVHEINIAEAAYLAAVPKAPANYHPVRHAERARARRNWVLGRMATDGYINSKQRETAIAKPLPSLNKRTVRVSPRTYFSEEVRRNLINMYGDKQLYGGGLSITTSLNEKLQIEAHRALLKGAFNLSRSYGWTGPVTNIDPSGDWGKLLLETPNIITDLPDWKSAIVLDVNARGARIGLRPGGQDDPDKVQRKTGTIPLDEMTWAFNADSRERPERADDVLSIGDVVYVQPVNVDDTIYALRKFPEVQGAIVAMSPETGRVYAMVGGLSFQASEFNRATQALRQLGSSFKPFVLAVALEQGYTPASVVIDAPIEIDQKNEDGIWQPRNYSGNHLGPATLRACMEKSCNLQIIRLALSIGMPSIIAYAKAVGAYDKLRPLLSVSLGASETTVLRIASAYAAFANGGYRVEPSLIDRVQDREGRVLLKNSSKACPACQAYSGVNSQPPLLIDKRQKVFSQLTAYQMTEVLQGVIQSGTGRKAKGLGKHIAGKTGTSNDEKDAWFVGYSTDLVVAVWLGFDKPQTMGKKGTGGAAAAPIFHSFMKKALEQFPLRPFPRPGHGHIVRFDKFSGNKALASSSGISQVFRQNIHPGDNQWVYQDKNEDSFADEITDDFDGEIFNEGIY